MAKRKIKVFISYSSKDNKKIELIENLKKLAEFSGFDIIIVPKEEDDPELLTAIVLKKLKTAQYVIPILTNESLNTQWINQEIGLAIGYNKKIFAIVEEGIIPDLKGFVHNQLKMSFTFKSNTSKSVTNRRFKESLIALLKRIEEKEKKPVKNRLKKATKNAVTKPIISEIKYLDWGKKRYIAKIGKLNCIWKTKGSKDILFDVQPPKFEHTNYDTNGTHDDKDITYLHTAINEQWKAEIKTDFDEHGNISFYFMHTNYIVGTNQVSGRIPHPSVNMNYNDWNGKLTGVEIRPMKVKKGGDTTMSFNFL